MSPETIFFILFGLIVAGAVGAVIWGVAAGKRRQAGDKVKPVKGAKPGRAAGGKANAGKAPAAAPARRTPTTKLSDKDISALEKKFVAARKRFSKTIDKRILREPIIGERLRRNRDMVLGWYEQKGKVQSVRYQAGDTRSACKVCQGRHGKEYSLLKTDVVARILPPSHADVGGKKECNCLVMPVMPGEGP